MYFHRPASTNSQNGGSWLAVEARRLDVAECPPCSELPPQDRKFRKARSLAANFSTGVPYGPLVEVGLLKRGRCIAGPGLGLGVSGPKTPHELQCLWQV